MKLTGVAVGQEAASSQAVNRGHKVTMVEVPNKEDDMAYQQWLAQTTKIMSTPGPPDLSKTATTPRVTSPMVVTPPAANAKAEEVPSQWMKPFKVDWMLCTICDT